MTACPPPTLNISPPLLNSASPWATSLDNLRTLYACPSTGAVTTRTSLIDGFDHDPSRHQYAFFDSASHHVSHKSTDPVKATPVAFNASLNSLGYSPIKLEGYLGFIHTIATERRASTSSPTHPNKGFIVSVTGDPREVGRSYVRIAQMQQRIPHVPLAVEVNLSCPNIPGKPPPAYSASLLDEYLSELQATLAATRQAGGEGYEGPLPRLPVGLKTPPYTHADEFDTLVGALLRSAQGSNDGICPVSFLTATNTLGSCLILSSSSSPAPGDMASVLPGDMAIGGMAGAPLHPLALGNVATLRRLLDEREAALGHRIQIIGTGGVLDVAAFQRMRAAGADVVGVGTGLGLRGPGIFAEIEEELQKAGQL